MGLQWVFLALVVALALDVVVSMSPEEKKLLAWVAPEELKNNYTYYLSGYDGEGASIWIIEFGKWDLEKVVRRGGKFENNFEIYVSQMFLRWFTSGEHFLVLADLDGLSMPTPINALRIAQKFLGGAQTFVTYQEKYMSLKNAAFLHGNVLFQTAWKLLKPWIATGMAYIELFGVNPTNWEPYLLKELPKDQIPPWYGGSQSHRPVKVYG